MAACVGPFVPNRPPKAWGIEHHHMCHVIHQHNVSRAGATSTCSQTEATCPRPAWASPQLAAGCSVFGYGVARFCT